ncbi:hypothetical protein D1007_60292 [Hordeum vulgare]|nr:hypothetical protein D1007_60292 [Hordeum vulgare]
MRRRQLAMEVPRGLPSQASDTRALALSPCSCLPSRSPQEQMSGSALGASPHGPGVMVRRLVVATPEEISPLLEEAHHRIEQDANNKRLLRNQGQPSSADPVDFVPNDVIRSETPVSVKQARVVHPPIVDDFQTELRATREQTLLYDTVKRFGNARATNQYMKQLKKSCLDRSKIIQCDSMYVDLRDLAESVRPTGKMSQNIVACGIDYIKNHMDVMFSMFQYLAPENSIDKCSHHYTICLHLKYQWFEVLDSIRSGDDTNLTSHVEFFVINLKETWNRHYGSSNVQISHFPIEYVLTNKQGNG